MPLQPANLEWRGTQPFAPDYDDIYYSEDGAAEVERVFIEPSGLLEQATRGSELSVLELGFGTGLNFIVSAARVLAETNARLHFISCERHPLTHVQWQRVADMQRHRWPLYQALAKRAPPVLPGWHRRVLADGRITLSVFHGGALTALEDLVARHHAPLHACYLDGFAPDRNPDMWRADLLALLARLARPGTRVATFTAAGAVRRGLEAVGFEMRKIDQRPFKRETLAGTFRATRATGASNTAAPRLQRPVTVHGAGIGGASVARHLAQQGTAVTVVDPAGIAHGASSMPAVLMHARLLADGSAAAAYRASAFHYALAYTSDMPGLTSSGVIQCLGPNLDEAKLRRIAAAYGADTPEQCWWIRCLEADHSRAVCGIALATPCLWFPTARTAVLRALCEHLLDHPNIRFEQRRAVLSPDMDHVICAGTASRQFAGCDWLEMRDVYGQLETLSTASLAIEVPLVGNGYVVPAGDRTIVGATYEYAPWDPARATRHNLELNTPYFAGDETWLGAARAARAVTSDRQPVVGRLADNLWIATGFGSMGATSAHLAAAQIVAERCGWIPPLDAAAAAAVDPARFHARQARRGRPAMLQDAKSRR